MLDATPQTAQASLPPRLQAILDKVSPLVPADPVTVEQAQRYLEEHKCTWTTAEKIAANPHMWSRIWAVDYAGPNVMAHHRPAQVTESGFAGAAQAFSVLNCPNAAKYRAGLYLQKAREHRANGMTKESAGCINEAGRWRRVAMRRAAKRELAA